ncbi:hypothetical protein [Streptomyces sp. NPDC015125]|uniref:hypothetical protein n=1 Tax=Streptomyces sp. NPDC015125 TaxID=3364938 RepID=UPI003701630F
MATPTDLHAPALASSISVSDRAFRILYALATEMDRGWVPVSSVAEQLEMTSHQIRLPLTELREAGITDHERRYEVGDTGRKTWHTYVRLVGDNASEAAA